MHTLVILNPGHFHAALVLREPHPALSDDIFVYSEKGLDIDRFMTIAVSFNKRRNNATRWRFHVYTGSDCLGKLIAEKKGDIVVLAGKNNTRMEHIEILTRSGFYILADKPWVISAKTFPLLNSAMEADRPLAMDIMTERYEITTMLQKKFIAEKGVFGDVQVDEDGSPSVYKESTHHLYKIVNGTPLVRPSWHFDIRVQGEGIVDVSTHLVDMTHWMLFPGEAIDFEKDIELLEARCWPTQVSLEKFNKITQVDRFPDSLNQNVENNILQYFCNGDLHYRVKEIPVHIRVIWNLEIPEGGGDTHRSVIKGTRSDLIVRQIPERGFKTELLIDPAKEKDSVKHAVQECLDKWSDTFPGLLMSEEDDKLLIHIPDSLRTTHEEHFFQVRDQFLEYLDKGSLPLETRKCIVSKYKLLGEARKMALASPFIALKTLF